MGKLINYLIYNIEFNIMYLYHHREHSESNNSCTKKYSKNPDKWISLYGGSIMLQQGVCTSQVSLQREHIYMLHGKMGDQKVLCREIWPLYWFVINCDSPPSVCMMRTCLVVP